MLKPLRSFVYRGVKMFEDMNGVRNRQRSGRRTLQAIKAVKKRIDRKPLRKQKILSREMNISKQSLAFYNMISQRCLRIRQFSRLRNRSINRSIECTFCHHDVQQKSFRELKEAVWWGLAYDGVTKPH